MEKEHQSHHPAIPNGLISPSRQRRKSLNRQLDPLVKFMAWEGRSSHANTGRMAICTFMYAMQNVTAIKPMKTIPSKTTHYSHCLPPEAYMRLWNASANTQQAPRFQSTYTPKKK
jgi:hypothetical protein